MPRKKPAFVLAVPASPPPSETAIPDAILDGPDTHGYSRGRMIMTFARVGIPARAICRFLGIEEVREITDAHMAIMRKIWTKCEGRTPRIAEAMGTTIAAIHRTRKQQNAAINNLIADRLRERISGLMEQGAKCAQVGAKMLREIETADVAEMTAPEKAMMATACSRAARDIAAVGTALFDVTRKLDETPVTSEEADKIVKIIMPLTATVDEWNNNMPEQFRKQRKLIEGKKEADEAEMPEPRPRDLKTDDVIQ